MIRACSSLLLCLPLLAAGGCNQTAATATEASGNRSAALAALDEAEAARARYKSHAVALDVISIVDPTGLSLIASDIAEREHERDMDERYRRIRAEVEKTEAEAASLRAMKRRSAAAPGRRGKTKASQGTGTR